MDTWWDLLQRSRRAAKRDPATDIVAPLGGATVSGGLMQNAYITKKNYNLGQNINAMPVPSGGQWEWDHSRTN